MHLFHGLSFFTEGANTSGADRSFVTCSYTWIDPSKSSWLWLTAGIVSPLFSLSAWGSSLCCSRLGSPAGVAPSADMSSSYDESSAADEAMDSFWEVQAFHSFSSSSVLCCVFASECVMRVKHTEATLCFMSESARKTTMASFLQRSGVSEGFHHLLRPVTEALFVDFGGLELRFCRVGSRILNWGRSWPHYEARTRLASEGSD